MAGESESESDDDDALESVVEVNENEGSGTGAEGEDEVKLGESDVSSCGDDVEGVDGALGVDDDARADETRGEAVLEWLMDVLGDRADDDREGLKVDAPNADACGSNDC